MEIMEFTCPRCGTHEFSQSKASGTRALVILLEPLGLTHEFEQSKASGTGICFPFNDPRYFNATGRHIPVGCRTDRR